LTDDTYPPPTHIKLRLVILKRLQLVSHIYLFIINTMFIFSSSNTVLAAFSAGALLVASAQGHLFAENSLKEASRLFPVEGNRFLEGNATDGHVHGTTHGVDIFEECVCDGDSVSCSHAEDEYMCYCHSDGVTALCNIYGVEIFEECSCDGDVVSCLHAEDSSMCVCDGETPVCDASALGDGGHDEAHGHVHGHTHGVDIFEDCACDGDSVSCSHAEDEYMCYCHSDGETAICLEYGYEIFEECSCDGETVNCLHTEDSAMCTCEGDAPVCDSSALGDHGHSHAMSEDSSASMNGASLIINLMALVGAFLVGGQ